MSLRALAWTILIAGVIVLGTLVNEADLSWQIFLNTVPKVRPRTTQTDLAGLFDWRGESQSPQTQAARAEVARLSRERAAAERAALDHLATLRAEIRWNEVILVLSAVVGLLGLLYLGWITRRDVRAWHWFTVLAFTALAAVAFLVLAVASDSPWRHAFLPLDGVALAAAALDLRRGQYDAPGRLFAWAALIVSILAGVVLGAMAFGV